MKIALVSTMRLVPWGGSEVLWAAAVQRLADDGVAVAVAYPRWPVMPAPLQALSVVPGIEVSCYGALPSFMQRQLARLQRRFGLARESESRRWLREQAPDLLCVSCGSPDDDPSWLQAARELGIPYVVLLQCESDLWPSDAEADARHALYAQARAVMFVAQANRRRCEQQLGRRLDNAEVVINHGSPPPGIPVPWPDADGVLRLACVGRLFPVAKGQDLIIEVMRQEKWRERAVEVHFFGSGPQEQILRRLVNAAGLQDQLHFRGQVAGHEAIWSQCHALLLPSRIEGLPLVIQEAMLCARPCIVTDVSGNAELLADGETAFIAEAPSVRHLDAAMERAWQARARWQDMGLAALAHASAVLPADPPQVLADRLCTLAGRPAQVAS